MRKGSHPGGPQRDKALVADTDLEAIPPKRMPPLNWLRSFEAAARHLSFTSAAEELFITQSAVSQQVRLLESFLGQPLFLRGRRGLQLTDSGRNYLPFVANAFKAIVAGTQSFLGYSDQDYLHIKSNNAFAIYWLMPRLGSFLSAHPEIRVHVTTALSEQDFEGANSGVEIRYGRGEWYGSQARLLAPLQIRPVCAPEVARGIKDLQDMAAIPKLHLSGLADGWDYWAEQTGNPAHKATDGHFFGTFALAYEMAKHGLGIALGHDILVDDMVRAGALAYPLDLPAGARDNYFLIVTDQEATNPAAVAFCRWIERQFRNEP